MNSYQHFFVGIDVAKAQLDVTITAAEEHRKTMKDIVKNVASVINIPFTVGGGIY